MAQVTVKPSGQGGDYTSLSGALSASETDILIDGTWSAVETGNLTVSTASTSIAVSSSAKHPGYDHGTLAWYRLQNSSSGHVLTISANNCTIDGLDIKQNDDGNSDECIRVNGAYTSTIKNSLLHFSGKNTDQDGIYCSTAGAAITVEQCIMWQGGRAGINLQTDAGVIDLDVNGCTFYNFGDNTLGPKEYDSGGVACKVQNVADDHNINLFNTISMDHDGDLSAGSRRLGHLDIVEYIYGGSFAATPVWDIHNCIGSEADAFSDFDSGASNCLYSHNITDDDTKSSDGDWVIVEDITTNIDLRLVDQTYNEAQDMHSSSSGAGLSIPSTDIVGTSRPQNTNYDCGAFEIAAATVSFSANITGSSSTSNIANNVARDLSASIIGLSSTSAIQLSSTKLFSGDITGISSTPAIALKSIVNFSATITGITSSTGLILNISRPISGSVIGSTLTGSISLEALRSLSATIAASTQTQPVGLSVSKLLSGDISVSTLTGSLSLGVLRGLTGDISGVSSTSAGDLLILRNLTGDIVGVTSTTNIALFVSGLINFSGDIIGNGLTPGIALNVLRDLSGDIAGVGVTSNISLAISRLLSGDVIAATSTSSIDLILSKLFAAAIAGISQTENVASNILRDITGDVTGATSTSNINLFISGMLNFVGDIIGLTSTPGVQVNVFRDLSGGIVGISTADAVLLGLGKLFSGDLSGVSSTSAIDLLTGLAFSGSIIGISDTSAAAMTQVIRPSADIVGLSSTDAVLIDVIRIITGSMIGTSDTQAIVLLVFDSLIPIARHGVSVDSVTPEYDVEAINKLEVGTI